jgi:hypothetical protein
MRLPPGLDLLRGVLHFRYWLAAERMKAFKAFYINKVFRKITVHQIWTSSNPSELCSLNFPGLALPAKWLSIRIPMFGQLELEHPQKVYF